MFPDDKEINPKDCIDQPSSRFFDRRAGRLVLEAHPHLSLPALYVHDLTRTPDAERLLSKPPSINPVTPGILSRMRQFNPEIAAKFVEKEDSVKQIPFKLITTNQFWTPGDIQCFVAISYCWHSDEWKVPDRFNAQQMKWGFPITPAMLKAVLQRCVIISGTASYLAIWIDQICIDQENGEEKTHAIASLDIIYRNAFEVDILLEDVDISQEEESTLRLFSTSEHAPARYKTTRYHFVRTFRSHLNRIVSKSLINGRKIVYSLFDLKWRLEVSKIWNERFKKSRDDRIGLQSSFHLEQDEIEGDLQLPISASDVDALDSITTKVYASRWFSRAWCRHECMLNLKALFIVIGQRSAFVTLSPSALPLVQANLNRSGSPGPLQGCDYSSLPAFEDFSYGISTQATDYTLGGCLFELFVRLQLLACSYQKDIISICFNASGIRLSFNGDIAHQGECKYTLALIALCAGDASVLGAEGLPIHEIDFPGHQPFLCWPGDFWPNWELLNHRSMPEMCNDAKIWDITLENISLDAFFLLSRPSVPPNEFGEDAAEVVTSLRTPFLSGDALDTSEKEYNRIYSDMLSCALSFGSRWIDTASRHLEERGLDDIHINKNQRRIITSAIIHHRPTSKGSMKAPDLPIPPSVVKFVARIASCRDWFANLIDTTALKVSLNSIGTEWAILLVPKNLARGVRFRVYHIAMPAAMNTAKAFSVRRVWILEPAKTDEAALAVVGRGFFIGSGPLSVKEHDYVRYASRVTIVGPWRDGPFSKDDSNFGEWDSDAEKSSI